MPTQSQNILDILLIDDDKVDRMLIRKALCNNGETVNIVEVATAIDSLKAAQHHKFDVVLLDYRLPDSDGLKLLPELRALLDEHTVIVLISELEDIKLANKVIEAGAQDLILKRDVNTRRLWRTLRQAQHRIVLNMELQHSHEAMRQLAERDSLTGLANRYTFEKTLCSSFASAQRAQQPLAVLMLDLDNFKNINDTLGHHVGDQLLIEIAKRLNVAVRESDFVARLGGDEFVVLAKNMERNEQMSLLAERILTAFSAPLIIDQNQLELSCSIGIAVLDDNTQDGTSLVKFADMAMYRAKKAGKNQYHFYSRSLHKTVKNRAALEWDLKRAVQQQQFELYYQIQVCAHTQKIKGIEALLRWNHPTRGVLRPAEFIDVAAELGLMTQIGSWVLEQACAKIHEWKTHYAAAYLKVSLAINISAIELQNAHFANTVINLLTQYDIQPRLLELEITGNALANNSHIAGRELKRLTDHGVRLTLDGFGTGACSFEHLCVFPVHALKIDHTFIAKIGVDPLAERLLIALIEFAKKLDLNIVAEGVETQTQAEFCLHHGCHMLQGYCYSAPLPIGQFESTFFRLEKTS